MATDPRGRSFWLALTSLAALAVVLGLVGHRTELPVELSGGEATAPAALSLVIVDPPQEPTLAAPASPAMRRHRLGSSLSTPPPWRADIAPWQPLFRLAPKASPPETLVRLDRARC